MKILISEYAISDLQSISSYIGLNLHNKNASDDIATGILREINRLKDSPFIGTPVLFRHSNIISIRVIRYGNYGAFYRVVGDSIEVDRVLYLKSDYRKVLENV